MSGWNAHDFPDRRGRVAVVTGSDGGLGYVAARELARRGARVVLACRSEARGTAARDRMLCEVPGARLRLTHLDLGDLGSVREFATAFPYDRLDLLLNNAGVMALPYGTTADGFERAGALPVLYAATAPDVRPDSFTGPSFAMWRGSPAPSWRAPWTLDDRAGELLWDASERLTGVAYDALKG
ncbi:SDR family NAD(P)-dependent oxidoreductase [Streptomyces sp. NPDC006385]|uniref:SDR family NAD(P)-dependent oxidoreductase n=1 Tax=Streptomyces sp. NPDC006385 TaxID=3156761 RepID=UPI0033A09D9E